MTDTVNSELVHILNKYIETELEEIKPGIIQLLDAEISKMEARITKKLVPQQSNKNLVENKSSICQARNPDGCGSTRNYSSKETLTCRVDTDYDFTKWPEASDRSCTDGNFDEDVSISDCSLNSQVIEERRKSFTCEFERAFHSDWILSVLDEEGEENEQSSPQGNHEN